MKFIALIDDKVSDIENTKEKPIKLYGPEDPLDEDLPLRLKIFFEMKPVIYDGASWRFL